MDAHGRDTQWLAVLRAGADALGATLTPAEEAQFARFLALLLDRNTRVNLTSITDPAEVAAKHFVDSLSVETVWTPRAGERAVDIGTGGGFPGLPLALRHPDVRFVLNDSVRKKVDFLDAAVTELALANVRTLWARAEVMGRDDSLRGKFDVALTRAVAHLGTLVEWALPLLKVGGVLIAMKGPSGAAEQAESTLALAQVGGEIDEIRRLTVPGAGERVLIVVRKVRTTPPRFPREPGASKKKPLWQSIDPDAAAR